MIWVSLACANSQVDVIQQLFYAEYVLRGANVKQDELLPTYGRLKPQQVLRSVRDELTREHVLCAGHQRHFVLCSDHFQVSGQWAVHIPPGSSRCASPFPKPAAAISRPRSHIPACTWPAVCKDVCFLLHFVHKAMQGTFCLACMLRKVCHPPGLAGRRNVQ